jgi:hypothetical protein
VKEEDAAELRQLLPALLELLAAIASGDRSATDAANEYLSLHQQVRRLLTACGEECICPWPNVWGWQGYAARLEDPEAWLVARAAKARILAGLDKPPPWTLEDYFRNGDPNDVPFWSEFADIIDQHKQAILEKSLNGELAYLGEGVSHGTKGHIWVCDDRRGARTKVLMYKIREGSPFGEVQLRVFFVTATDFRLVLLHGYDKGADADRGREDREAAEACQRREDLMRQRADGQARA